jgi:hypothetical protein
MKAPVQLTWTWAYLDRKATLSLERRRSLELVEEGIAADPHSPVGRREGPDGTLFDYSEFGLYVTFRFRDEVSVQLVDFVDLTPER